MVLSSYTFEAYLGFLRNTGMVTAGDEVHYAITPLGKDFLQWMVLEGVSEAKPA